MTDGHGFLFKMIWTAAAYHRPPICVVPVTSRLNSGPHAIAVHRIGSAFDVDLLVANQNEWERSNLMVSRALTPFRRGLATLDVVREHPDSSK